MRLRKVKNAKETLEKSPYYIKDKDKYRGHYEELFQNKNPIHLEIGMGKGTFLIEMAKTYPDINFIGVEKEESVLVRAIEKMTNIELNNIRFICCDAKELNQVFTKEIATIYLNFSDPWPKNRHSERRLTSKSFLEIYDQIFAGDPHIIEKTDNIVLFAYSLESLSKYGYYFEKVTLDLASQSIFNIKTEYEEKFSNLGFKINYLEAIKRR